MAGARAEVEAQARLADELHQPTQLFYVATCRSTLASFEGRFEEAEHLMSPPAKSVTSTCCPTMGVTPSAHPTPASGPSREDSASSQQRPAGTTMPTATSRTPSQ
jgi:hypothetical protein